MLEVFTSITNVVMALVYINSVGTYGPWFGLIALSKTPLINSIKDLEAFIKLEYASTDQKTVEQDFASSYILGN